MRGRWASAAIGAGVARRRAAGAAEQQNQQHEAEMKQAQEKIDAQQKQLEALQSQKQQPAAAPQEDITQKLMKYNTLKEQGAITEQEFQKLKMDLLAKV